MLEKTVTKPDIAIASRSIFTNTSRSLAGKAQAHLLWQ